MLKDIEISIIKRIILRHSKGWVCITKEELDMCLNKDGSINEKRINKLYDYKYSPEWMCV